MEQEQGGESEEFEELPTLECEGCGHCTPKAKAKCIGDEWEEDTQPTGPVFMRGYDDDYILDELGGESG